ncbi:hypothetical protein DFH07DRAFT_781959 [Mycena maculata]|uniref:Uncharacterized protein n=1 Tax=Mycena maculata TaxID=230809 RepID=A0AAD7HVR5_9AGAR|nr:hypothetical protein DFH07DRAFT_781959 [Mycena maculata]
MPMQAGGQGQAGDLIYMFHLFMGVVFSLTAFNAAQEAAPPATAHPKPGRYRMCLVCGQAWHIPGKGAGFGPMYRAFGRKCLVYHVSAVWVSLVPFGAMPVYNSPESHGLGPQVDDHDIVEVPLHERWCAWVEHVEGESIERGADRGTEGAEDTHLLVNVLGEAGGGIQYRKVKHF